MSDDKYLNKIAALLRQAESTQNEHEAEAFMQAAQRLATTTAISLEVARQHQANKEKRETPIQRRIAIGDRGKKGLKYYVRLFLAIAEQNDVRCNVAHNSTFVIAFGFPSDIEVSEMLYASVVVQMIEGSERFLRSKKYRKETVRVESYVKEYDPFVGRTVRVFDGYKEKPVDGRVARANFMESFIQTIRKRLWAARTEAIAEAKRNDVQDVDLAGVPVESTGTELVLANKAVEIADFYKQNSDARGTWGGNSGSTGYSNTARNAGRAAGESARLSSQRAIGGGQRQIRD